MGRHWAKLYYTILYYHIGTDTNARTQMTVPTTSQIWPDSTENTIFYFKNFVLNLNQTSLCLIFSIYFYINYQHLHVKTCLVEWFDLLTK